MAYKITTAPAQPVLPMSLLYAQCKLIVPEGETHPEDSLLQLALASAQRVAQHHTNTAVGVQTIELALDAFPSGPLALPLSPFVSLEAVSYVAPDMVVRTVPTAQIAVDDYDPASPWLIPAPGASWPDTAPVANAVKVRYVAGADPIPLEVQQAMLLIVAHYHRNKQAASDKATAAIWLGVDTLLNVSRVHYL